MSIQRALESVIEIPTHQILVDPSLKADTKWAERELNVELGTWFVSHIHPVPEIVSGCPNADRAVSECINFPGLV